MDDNPVRTTPNHHPPKLDVLQKKFLQIILTTKWLVRHSSSPPNLKRRPLHSLLSDSYSILVGKRISNDFSMSSLYYQDYHECGGDCLLLGAGRGVGQPAAGLRQPCQTVKQDLQQEGQSVVAVALRCTILC